MLKHAIRAKGALNCSEFCARRYDVSMPAIGPLEIGVVLLIILLIVGPKKLPGLGRNLGTGMREFKDSITSRGGDSQEDDEPATIDVAAEVPVSEKSAAPEEQPRGDA